MSWMFVWTRKIKWLPHRLTCMVRPQSPRFLRASATWSMLSFVCSMPFFLRHLLMRRLSSYFPLCWGIRFLVIMYS
ncbi:hypothetical protein FGIG_12249 [Fasciola gigantica]|uniref:Uncharacterized protein n=1 Tax=Fasciola gigantica TaxID=46835 RepID=A0A504YHB3_FASGI|nr:hypothetical protein FGIG_12249 [Fasciola gigantica]